MKNRYFSLSAVAGIALLVVGCNEFSRDELMAKVGGKTAPADIVAAIGKADTVVRDGAIEHWRYSASGGDLCFSVVGSLAMRMGCL